MSTLPVLTFGALLRRARLAAGLSQEELAERAHLSREAISTLERGTRRAPRQETIDLLADALSLAPAERARLHQVARGQAPPPIAAVSHPRLPVAREMLFPLIGRQPEVARLARHLAGEGSPLLLFAGEPGIGKSRLLQEAVQWARAQGWTVLEGGCHRRSGQEPFAPLLGALEGRLRYQPAAQQRQELPGCAWLVRLLPELTEVMPTPAASWSLPPEQERRLMFAAVARYLANVAGPAGTLLVLDDLQWAGADALDLLAHLLRTPGEQPPRVVAAYRSTEVRPPDPLGALLADLGAAGLAGEMRLGPLAPVEASTLLQSVLESEQGTASTLHAQVIERTGGVPYFLVSCAQALRLSQQEGGPAPQVPWNVAQSIRQRVITLPDAAQDLLGAAAVVGREAPGALLLAVVAQPKAEQVAALEELHRVRLLVESAEAVYQFPHDLIREVVLADLSAVRRRQWHGLVAQALEQAPGEAFVERLAHHYSHAGDMEKAILYLERAAERAQARYAHTEAEGYYQRLIEQLEALGRREQADQTREHLGAVLLTAARHEQALETLERAVADYQARADREGVARATAQIGWAHALRGSFTEGIARVQPILGAAISPPLSAQGLAYLYDALAQLFLRSARYTEQLAAAERACAYAEEAQDTRLLARDKLSYGLALAYLDRKSEAIPLLESALPLLQSSGDLWRQFDALGSLSWMCALWGDFPRMQEYIAQAQAIVSQIDNPHLVPEMRFFHALNAWMVGDWDQCLLHLEQARSLLGQTTNVWVIAQVLVALGYVHLFRGHAIGEQYLDEAHHLTQHPFIRWLRTIILSEYELVHGDMAAAAARLESMLEGSSILTGYLLNLMAWAVFERDPERAAGLIEQGRTFANSSMRGLTDGLRIQALLAIHQGQWQAAEQALEQALPMTRAMPYPYGEAKALYVYGRLHQAKGEPDRARERLEAALAILNRLGERLYAEQVERALAGLAARS